MCVNGVNRYGHNIIVVKLMSTNIKLDTYTNFISMLIDNIKMWDVGTLL